MGELMLKLGSKLVLVILIIFYVFPTFCLAYDDEDFAIWHIQNYSIKLNDNWKIALDGEMHFSDDVERGSYYHADFGAVYSGFAPWVDVGGFYRQIYSRSSDDWQDEKRPHIDIILKKNLDFINFKNRGRFEYRYKKNSDHFWRYRNKFYFIYPKKFTKKNIQPYAAEEIFVDFDIRKLNQNRWEAGFLFDISESIKASVFYLRQSSKSNGIWTDTNVFGSSLGVKF